MRKFVKNAFYQLVTRLMIARTGIAFQKNRLQIIAYHGVCLPEDIRFPWVSPAFATTFAFDLQMSFIKRHMTPLSLKNAVAMMKKGRKLPERAVAITFDDGYANNLVYAEPILKKYEIPATIFLATDSIDNGTLFHFDRINCLKYWSESGLVSDEADKKKLADLPDYKNVSIYNVEAELSRLWGKFSHMLDDDQKRLLSPMSWQMAKKSGHFIDYGAHTCGHAILSRISEADRKKEIENSVGKIREILEYDDILFSYPNGEKEDFGRFDQEILKRAGVLAAVTVIRGSNPLNSNLYALRRRMVSLGHTIEVFEAELGHIRDLIGRDI
ncbi:polysaccharide deacetylase family protein [Desulfobacterales bacterium HSG16]|nr:polysaccharide deacetylase family protein [Desulfobacterales bacterium HSG16]